MPQAKTLYALKRVSIGPLKFLKGEEIKGTDKHDVELSDKQKQSLMDKKIIGEEKPEG